MLNIRTRVFIIVSVIIFIILAVAVGIMALRRAGDKNPEGETVPTTTGTIEADNFNGAALATQPTVIPAGTKVKTLTTEEMKKNAATQIAKIFAERYGTYSTHQAYENIRDVEEMVTDRLWQELSARLPAPGVNETSVYSGVITRAITAEITDWRDNGATVLVGVIRTESQNGGEVNNNQTMTVEVVEVGEEWLVDSFE